MTHPTTAGVLASFGSLGDVIVAEPGALLSFTGPRVVQQTVREKLPDDFGLAESNYRLGPSRRDRRATELGPSSGGCWRCSPMDGRPGQGRPSAIEQLRLRERLAKLGEFPLLRGTRMQESSRASAARSIGSRLSRRRTRSGGRFQLARHKERLYTLDYAERILEEGYIELHGDRSNVDDSAVVTLLGRFGGRTVVLIGHQKGRDIHERARRNFGMALPEGYRKAIRAMELADRHGFPVLTLIDTPRAYPGVAAEQHGQGAGSRAPRP